MSDEKDDPKEQLIRGLGLLFRAARGAATGLRKEVDRAESGQLGKSIDDAGRELVRAASNVLSRLAAEVTGDGKKPPPPPDDKPKKPGGEGDTPDDKAKKPKGPTPDDPGFSIMTGEDDDKPR